MNKQLILDISQLHKRDIVLIMDVIDIIEGIRSRKLITMGNKALMSDESSDRYANLLRAVYPDERFPGDDTP